MSRRPAVVFCMPQGGHFRRLVPVVAGLVEAGVPTHVFSGPAVAADVARAGARFVDLFDGRPLEAADAQSHPMPSRYVSFAGHYGDDVTRAAAALRPGLVVHDTFAVIGQVVANHLGVPRVNVCAGHNAAPGPTLAALRVDPRVATAPACHAAVRVLRERHGIADASPFSYVTALSSDLNVCCEPPQFLREADRAPFEPLAFFGSFAADAAAAPAAGPPLFGPHRLRIYASFGKIIWRYYADAGLAALAAVADAVAALPDAGAILSLGGEARAAHAARLTRPNVRVEALVDQMRVLREATVFVTHHGLKSTHEAVLHRVPMLSYPFFGDQPAMAVRCQELGLALPLVTTPQAPVTPARVRDVLAALAAQRAALDARLADAREWELAVMRDRPAVIARMVALMER